MSCLDHTDADREDSGVCEGRRDERGELKHKEEAVQASSWGSAFRSTRSSARYTRTNYDGQQQQPVEN